MRYATVGINRLARLLKQVVNEAAGEKNTGGVAVFTRPTPELSEQLFSQVGYVEDIFEMRTKLGACFSNQLKVADGAL